MTVLTRRAKLPALPRFAYSSLVKMVTLSAMGIPPYGEPNLLSVLFVMACFSLSASTVLIHSSSFSRSLFAHPTTPATRTYSKSASALRALRISMVPLWSSKADMMGSRGCEYTIEWPESAPADCPPKTMRRGSPPKEARLSRSHSSARRWSRMPRFWCRRAGELGKPKMLRR